MKSMLKDLRMLIHKFTFQTEEHYRTGILLCIVIVFALGATVLFF